MLTPDFTSGVIFLTFFAFFVVFSKKNVYLCKKFLNFFEFDTIYNCKRILKCHAGI